MSEIPRAEISRNISSIEAREIQSGKKLSKIFSSDSLRRSLCFTGPGGVGKSSLLSELSSLATKDKTVAWLACDPSSPVSGGSLLGDRIRTSGQKLSDNLFIRSLSTRSSQAFSRSIRDIEVYLEQHFDEVWVETAGSGQTQHEVSEISAITILILQPETGDEVQWMKSGLRECADLFVVNKSDLGGAESMQQSLIELGAPQDSVLICSSKTREGLPEILEWVERRRKEMDWESRAELLHDRLSEALFLEAQMLKFRKRYDRQKKAWRSNPYREMAKILA